MGVDADQLLKKADMALYAAKNGGGGDHRFFALEMEEAAQERRALELDLRDAIASEQFDLNFQPLVDLRNGRVTTCEALLRWQPSEARHGAAAVFIPDCRRDRPDYRARRMGLAAAPALEAARWPKSVKVAVNLSPVQFRDRGLALQVVIGAGQVRPPAQRLELEVTERLLLEDSDGTLADHGAAQKSRRRHFARRLRHRLFLAQLFAQIPVPEDQDRPVVYSRPGGEERDAQAIIGAVAGLGAELDKTVVAEGIETEQQMRQVKAHGCHEGQGHFFGEPMTAETIRARLEASTSVAQLVA